MQLDSTCRDFIIKKFNNSEIKNTELIQNLWSNYGVLARVFLDGSDYSTIIVKHIKLDKKENHPRNWNTNASHQRKLKSYQVETNWYKNFNNFRDSFSYFPKLISSEVNETEIILILEDLDSIGFDKRIEYPDDKEIMLCLEWLASFHSKGFFTKENGLWEKGTYWHLGTRLDEFQSMEECKLKDSAEFIDKTLDLAKYKTIIHGDAKIANFCFSSDSSIVAAVDFQYIGKGCAMKDLVYFLSSVLDEDSIKIKSTEYIDQYFKLLEQYIKKYNVPIEFGELEREWRKLYDYAVADFERFLLGWMPTHYKLNNYTKEITENLISKF